jgi:hypothetical protein
VVARESAHPAADLGYRIPKLVRRLLALERCGDSLIVGICDEPTREFLLTEYSEPVHQALAALGVTRVEYVVTD